MLPWCNSIWNKLCFLENPKLLFAHLVCCCFFCLINVPCVFFLYGYYAVAMVTSHIVGMVTNCMFLMQHKNFCCDSENCNGLTFSYFDNYLVAILQNYLLPWKQVLTVFIKHHCLQVYWMYGVAGLQTSGLLKYKLFV